jgi:N-acetylglucosaminyl-diphospho-decaprenol L-rhamnosyltransferase
LALGTGERRPAPTTGTDDAPRRENVVALCDWEGMGARTKPHDGLLEGNVVRLQDALPPGSGTIESGRVTVDYLAVPEAVCSVVVVSYKTGPVLIDCLRSLLSQRCIKQVILVDNGNTQASRDDIAALQSENPRLEVVVGQGNVGFSRGCNLGAARARGRYLLLLNPDCVLEDGVLADAIQVLEDDPSCSLMTVRLENPDGSEQRGGRRNLLTPWTCMVEQFRLDRLAPNHPHFKRLNLNETEPFTEITPVQCISGAFMLMPKEAFHAVGGMDEDYFLHVEDIDFCMKMEQKGRKILYAPHLKVTHVRSTSNVYPAFVEWHKSLSVVKYFHKHFQPQYPSAILKIISAAIFMRFVLRLLPMTVSWVFELIGGSSPAPRTHRPAAAPVGDRSAADDVTNGRTEPSS